MSSNHLPLSASPIQFGTDGWRGILGVDVTLDRLLRVAAASAQELAYQAPSDLKKSRRVIIGFDRRFLAPEFAEAIAASVRGCDLEPLLTETPVPTPACSWAVIEKQALGALVITASHNPSEWIGLKIKGPFGGSVQGDFTKAVELRLAAGGKCIPIKGITKRFDGRKEHLDGLRRKFDIPRLASGLREMGIKVIVDPMHGSAAGCIPDLFGTFGENIIEEIRGERDPLFGGNPPEPLAPYLTDLIQSVKSASKIDKSAIGLVFDGDGDRIAAIDEDGGFCSTQLLMPLLIDHLARVRKLPGSVVKTVSGSDLMTLVAKDLDRNIIELPVGFKYIATEMLSGEVLVGGEESGGVGFGIHLPERDALFAALLILEALVQDRLPLGARIKLLQDRFGGGSQYDRIDIRLENMDSRHRLESLLLETPPKSAAGYCVKEVIRTDGLKLRLGHSHWLMMRFSGTEPLLRLYCEAPTKQELDKTLAWAKDLAKKI